MLRHEAAADSPVLPGPYQCEMVMDKAGQKYWNDSWAASTVPDAVNPRDMSLNNWTNRQFHQLFARLFDTRDMQTARLLEIGCAKSAWLPYFSKEFGFKVCGIDYSPIGAEMARNILQKNGIEPEVVCADLFAPPQHMFGAFDVVVSFGVAEHFEDTSAYLRAASLFLKPGGMLITNIPNMVGWIGYVQKVVNRPVYDIHQLIDQAALKEAHTLAALDVLDCSYFMSTSFGVNNLVGISTRTPIGFLKKLFLGVLARVSVLVWFVEDKFGSFPTNRHTSPYINCISLKAKCRPS